MGTPGQVLEQAALSGYDQAYAHKQQRKDMLTDEDHALKRDLYLKDLDSYRDQLKAYKDANGNFKPEYADQVTKLKDMAAQREYEMGQLYDPIKAPGRLQQDWHYLRERIHGIKQPQTPVAPRVSTTDQAGTPAATVQGMSSPVSIPGAAGSPDVVLGLTPAPITSPELPAYKQTNLASASPAAPKPLAWKDRGQYQSPSEVKQIATARQKAQQEAGLLAAGAGLSLEQEALSKVQVNDAALQAALRALEANPLLTPEEKDNQRSILTGGSETGSWKIVGSVDGKPVSFDSKSNRYRLPDGSISLAPPDGFISTEKSTGAKPQAYYNAAVNLNTALQLQNQGTSYKGEDGNPIDLSSLPKDSILVPVFTSGGKSYWSVATDRGRYETGNNQRYLEPAVGLPNPNAPSIGEARVPTSRTSVTPGPNGLVTTTSVTSPVTGGGGGRSARPVAPYPPSPRPSAPSGSVPQATAPPSRGGVSKPSTKNIPTPTPQSNNSSIPPLRDPKLPAMKGADERAIASIAAPVATVEQQVVGRGARPLWEYSKVLNSPELLKAVNLAMAAPMLQTPEGSKNPGFWATITTALGLSTAAQQATTAQIVAARNRVQKEGGPQAVEFLDRLSELKGTIPNLRKIQGGSSAMGAMQPLYQESPIMNISSPEDFRNRTANMLRTIAIALDNTPGINKNHVNWLYSQADQAQSNSRDVLKKKAALLNPTKEENVIPPNTIGQWTDKSTGKTYYVDKDYNRLGEVKNGTSK
jgi:hypothetical protein